MDFLFTNVTPNVIPENALLNLQRLIDSAPVAIVVVNRMGAILYVNTRLEELFGYAKGELLGQVVELLLPARFHTIHQQHRMEYMYTPHVRSMGSRMDLAGRRKDGSEFSLEAGLSYLILGEEMVVLTTINDISRRKQNEELLERLVEERTRELERRQQVSDGLREILTILNSNRSLPNILNFIVQQACRLSDADACAVFGREEQRGRLVIQASEGLQQGEVFHANEVLNQVWLDERAFQQPFILTSEQRQSNGRLPATLGLQERWLADLCFCTHLIIPIKVKHDIYGALLFCYNHQHDFTEEDIQLGLTLGEQTALAIENTRLYTQIERTAVTAERNRIARDLHDAVTQTLFSASMIADVLPKMWQRNPAEARRRIDELRELTRGALAEMRTLLLELRPAKLMEIDLADLLRQLAESVTGRTRIPIMVQVEGNEAISDEVKVALYRIAQEALNNVAKHSQAKHGVIKVRRSAEMVELSVTDDGCGFVFAHIAPQHLGLGIMRERAEDIGASLTIQSQPGQGTTISVHWVKAKIAH
jgi:PAS domain S-box-containing protein